MNTEIRELTADEFDAVGGGSNQGGFGNQANQGGFGNQANQGGFGNGGGTPTGWVASTVAAVQKIVYGHAGAP